MLRGLQVGFGYRIGPPLYAELAARGVQMSRLDMLRVESAYDLAVLTHEALDAGMCPLLIIRPDQATWLADEPLLDVEIWNEPNLGTAPTPRMTPAQYADALHEARGLLGPVHRIWAGAISNLNEEALDWLQCSLPSWPREGIHGVSVHRYPDNGSGAESPHKGFVSRAAEVARLREIIGPDTPWAITEFGHHEAVQTSGRWYNKRKWTWTAEQVAGFVAWEWAFWERQGAALAVLYQLNDGTGHGYIDHFGIRRHPDDPEYVRLGEWKPVADTFRLQG